MDVTFSYLGVSFFWLGVTLFWLGVVRVGGCDLYLAGCGWV